jgi:hypothetical protein
LVILPGTSSRFFGPPRLKIRPRIKKKRIRVTKPTGKRKKGKDQQRRGTEKREVREEAKNDWKQKFRRMEKWSTPESAVEVRRLCPSSRDSWEMAPGFPQGPFF